MRTLERCKSECDRGIAFSYTLMGARWLNSEYRGMWQDKNPQKARKYFKKAYDLKDCSSYMYLNGDGGRQDFQNTKKNYLEQTCGKEFKKGRKNSLMELGTDIFNKIKG